MKRSVWRATSLLIIMVFALVSCRSQKKITYFQDVQKNEEPASRIEWKNFTPVDSNKLVIYEPLIQPNDILKIYITSINKEASSFFNPLISTDVTVDDPQAYGYLVDSYGMIEIPVMGSVKVAGLTVPQIRDTLKVRLSKYLDNPAVRIIFNNYKVTLLGEVMRPGVYTVQNERITLPEALGLAGDLSIFANRKNILIIREDAGERTFTHVDITNRDFFKSPHYFLHPNDIVYVEPGRGKVAQSDIFYRIAPIVISTLTLIAVILVRFQK